MDFDGNSNRECIFYELRGNRSQSTPHHGYNTRYSERHRRDSTARNIINCETPQSMSGLCQPILQSPDLYQTNLARESAIKDRILLGYTIALAAIISIFIAWYGNSLQEQITDILHQIESNKNAMHEIIQRVGNISRELKELKQHRLDFQQPFQKPIDNESNKINLNKIEQPDFALESMGGRIVRLLPGTENYDTIKRSLLGISFCENVMHGPRSMIQASTVPGDCWAFKGSSGGAVLKLAAAIQISAVSMEHIAKNVSPTGATNAPGHFTVSGLKSIRDKPILLGQFTYNIHAPLIQTFLLPQHSKLFEYVELKILSNHGHPNFTCIYRFRVYGKL